MLQPTAEEQLGRESERKRRSQPKAISSLLRHAQVGSMGQVQVKQVFDGAVDRLVRDLVGGRAVGVGGEGHRDDTTGCSRDCKVGSRCLHC
jgi:hypothetical protein